jgi:hypothetical protein
VHSLLIRPHEVRVPGHVGGEDRGEADRGHLSRSMIDWLNQVYRETRGGPIPIERGRFAHSGERNPKPSEDVGKVGLTARSHPQ